MKYKLVIFDFDGTLADSFPWFISILGRVADKYRFNKVKAEEIEKFRGKESHQILKDLGISFWKMPFIARYMRKLMREEIHTINLFNGIDSLLQQINGMGVTLAIVTSNSYENVSAVLGAKNMALIKYFECGVSMFGKRAKLNKVIKACGVSRTESILIGDEIRDIEAAQGAGIASGAVIWGYSSAPALEAKSPTIVFTSIDDILS